MFKCSHLEYIPSVLKKQRIITYLFSKQRHSLFYAPLSDIQQAHLNMIIWK